MEQEIKLITNNHDIVIKNHIKNSKKSIKIISPFISFQSLDFIKDSNADITIITRFSLEDFAKGSSSIDCLSELLNSNNVKIYAMKDLHTKLYIFDDNTAILGSANFTDGGLNRNVELSVEFAQNTILEEVIEYFNDSLKSAKDNRITKELILKYKNKYDFKQTTKENSDSYDGFSDIFPTNEVSGENKYQVIRTRTIDDLNLSDVGYIVLGNGKVIPCNSQKECLVKFIIEVGKYYPQILEQILQDNDGNRFISTNPLNFIDPRAVGKNIFLETNNDSLESKYIIKKTIILLKNNAGFFHFCKKNDVKINDVKENTTTSIYVKESLIENIDAVIKESVKNIKKYKIADVGCYRKLIDKDVTFYDMAKECYGIEKSISGRQYAAKLFPNDKNIKYKGSWLKNHLQNLIINESYDKLYDFIKEINGNFNSNKKINLQSKNGINYKLIADIIDKFPNCNFKLDTKNSSIIKK